MENCKLHDLPVEAYLKELLTALPGVTDPEVIATLTPARIAAARRNQPREDRVA
ncbi:transposase domain-containing protein [Haloferula sargassicola]|uniref:Transposase IS66 C-terminal domain-containing protein n=1 Tax=Haloferula sargassicola TaxID=490096 RepID=A0ABP9UYB8_9BACT